MLLVASVFCLTGSLRRWLSGMIKVQEMLCFSLHHQGLHVKETVLLVQPGRIYWAQLRKVRIDKVVN